MNLKLILHLCVVFFLFACKGGINNSVSSTQAPIILYASPNSGVVGDQIKITGTTFHDNAMIMFNNITHPTRSDSFNLATIYTYVPFDAKNGDINIKLGDNLGIVKNFEVIEQCIDTLCVMPYDLNYSITQSNASSYYPDYPFEFNWEIFFDKDSITIFSKHEIPGESIETINLVFLQKEIFKLPVLLRAFYKFSRDDGQINTYQMRNFAIKIQDWNWNGLYSGRVISSWDWYDYFHPFSFWCQS